jgi:stage IV sporulation protein FB
VLTGNLPPTQFDLNFRLAGIPVRVHPLFWLVALLLGMQLPPPLLVIWVPVVFASILVHEMGHALAIRAFGWWPSILLYSFGGLAIYQPTYRAPQKRILILLAGPGAGFLFAAAICGAVKASGYQLVAKVTPYGLMIVAPGLVKVSENLFWLTTFLLEVNIGWGLINLLPVYPLDGGQICSELFELLRVPDGLVKSLWVSIVTAVAVVVYALTRLQDFYLAAMFGYLAFSGFQTLQHYSGRGGGYGRW